MDYYELRNQIRKGIVALLGIQPKRTVKEQGGSVYVDDMEVPLYFDQWGYTGVVAVRIGNSSKRDGVLRSKKDGSFPYSKIVTQILEYVDLAKKREEERKREREAYDRTQKVAKRLNESVRDVRCEVYAYYNGTGRITINCNDNEWADMESLTTLIKMMRKPNFVSPEELDKLVAILTRYHESLSQEENEAVAKLAGFDEKAANLPIINFKEQP